MNLTRTYCRRALDGFHNVITSFPEDRWDEATPCSRWMARMLTGHVIDGQLQVAAMLNGNDDMSDQDRLLALSGRQVALVAAQW